MTKERSAAGKFAGEWPRSGLTWRAVPAQLNVKGGGGLERVLVLDELPRWWGAAWARWAQYAEDRWPMDSGGLFRLSVSGSLLAQELLGAKPKPQDRRTARQLSGDPPVVRRSRVAEVRVRS